MLGREQGCFIRNLYWPRRGRLAPYGLQHIWSGSCAKIRLPTLILVSLLVSGSSIISVKLVNLLDLFAKSVVFIEWITTLWYDEAATSRSCHLKNVSFLILFLSSFTFYCLVLLECFFPFLLYICLIFFYRGMFFAENVLYAPILLVLPTWLFMRIYLLNDS